MRRKDVIETITFPLDDGRVENMHAVRAGDGLFVLDNSPFYAYGVSYKDRLEARMEEGRWIFARVVQRGGHSTYRIMLPEGKTHQDFLKEWTELESKGCTFEGSSGAAARLYAIDVPPSVDVASVYDVLQAKEEAGIWTFEEGHYYGGNH